MKCNPRFLIEVRRRKGGQDYVLPHKASDYRAMKEAYGLIKPYTTDINVLRELARYAKDFISMANTIAAMSRDCVEVLVDNKSLRRLRASWHMGFRPVWEVTSVFHVPTGDTVPDTNIIYYPIKFTINDDIRIFEIEVYPSHRLTLMSLEEYKSYSKDVDALRTQLETLSAITQL